MEDNNKKSKKELLQEYRKQHKRIYDYLGILMAVLMLFAVLVTSFESVIYSPSNYIEFQAKYETQPKLGINADEYRYFYNSFIDYLSKGDKTALENTFGSGEKERPMFTAVEKEYMQHLHNAVLLFSILRWLAVAGSIAVLIYVLLTAQRRGLIQLGKAIFLSTIVLIVLAVTCILFARQHLETVMNTANNLFTDGMVLPENLTLSVLLPKAIFNEVAMNWAKMAGVFTLIPLAVSLGLARMSLVKTDETDDYIYQ